MKESKLMLETRFVFPDRVKMRDIDEETLEGLMASIEKKGQKQPISVREAGPGAYRVNFGEHRLEACKRLGIKVWATVEDIDEDEALLLKVGENSHRNGYIDPLREGEVFSDMLRRKYRTVNELAEALGKRTAYVQDRLAVWRQLAVQLRKHVGKELTVTNAIKISKITNHLDQIALANKIFEAQEAMSPHEGQGWGGGGYYPTKVSLVCTCSTCGQKHRKKEVPEIVVEAPDSGRS